MLLFLVINTSRNNIFPFSYGYPKWVFEKINEECKLSSNLNITTKSKNNINNDITNTTHMLVLPYKGERGQRITKSINNNIKNFFHKTMLYRMFIKVRS